MISMRQLMEAVEAGQMPEDLLHDLQSWQEYYDRAEAWGDTRHPWQQKLIAYMKGREPKLDGLLYRASVIDDKSAWALLNGQTGIHQPSDSLLESWSKRAAHALEYFEVIDTENLSAVLMAVPATKLDVIFDYDDLEDSMPIEANEVLVKVAPRRLTPESAMAVVFADFNGTQGPAGHRRFAVHGQEVDEATFTDYLVKLHRSG